MGLNRHGLWTETGLAEPGLHSVGGGDSPCDLLMNTSKEFGRKQEPRSAQEVRCTKKWMESSEG